ncbi:MAG: hypothetical protein H6712_18965 [Myxococcales bacterium]|nr:hypothetical protein [Myxococcales bacterium]MCB9715956.1 hypothetical protein [Myxococcales bacterium]
MSYERAMEEWTHETASTAAPSLTRIGALHRTGANPSVVSPSRALAIRVLLGLAILGFVGVAVLEQFVVASSQRSGRTLAVSFPIAALLLAMGWLRRHDLAKQMMVRALSWSALVIGTIISVFGSHAYSLAGPPIALGSGLALLLLGNRGLGITSRSFQPIAYRNHLLLALVLATADAGTLLFAAAMQLGIFLQHGTLGYLLLALPTFACGLLMAIAVVGIHRLRTWALVLNLVANLGIAYLAMSGYLGLTIPVATALATTATIQLLLPVPILAVALGDPLRDRSPLGRAGGHVLRLGLVLMIGAGVLGPLLAQGPYSTQRSGWVERVHRTWVRGVAPGGPVTVTHRGIEVPPPSTSESPRVRYHIDDLDQADAQAVLGALERETTDLLAAGRHPLQIEDVHCAQRICEVWLTVDWWGQGLRTREKVTIERRDRTNTELATDRTFLRETIDGIHGLADERLSEPCRGELAEGHELGVHCSWECDHDCEGDCGRLSPSTRSDDGLRSLAGGCGLAPQLRDGGCCHLVAWRWDPDVESFGRACKDGHTTSCDVLEELCAGGTVEACASEGEDRSSPEPEPPGASAARPAAVAPAAELP